MSGAAELGQLGSVVTVDSATGNVGIGGAPSYPLDVKTSTKVAARFGGAGTFGGAVILSFSANQGLFGAGWDHDGTNFIARDTTAMYLGIGLGTFGISSNTGLTSGTTWSSPTTRVFMDDTGSWTFRSPVGFGYGPGAGGTVTQITNKSTAVTLNKPCGNVITSNAALAAGASATFTVTNSTMTASDVVIVNPTNGNYRAKANNNAGGSFTITLTNESAGSLSDAVQIQFAIIKAFTS